MAGLLSHVRAACHADCRGKLVDVMLSSYGEAQGDYDEAAPQAGAASRAPRRPAAFAHLHARLLWCQVAGDALAQFRDRVLVPALTEALATPNRRRIVEDLVGLVALVPEPLPRRPSDADGARRLDRTDGWHATLPPDSRRAPVSAPSTAAAQLV